VKKKCVISGVARVVVWCLVVCVCLVSCGDKFPYQKCTVRENGTVLFEKEGCFYVVQYKKEAYVWEKRDAGELLVFSYKGNGDLSVVREKRF